MRCERCGKELTNRIIKINGVTYCENCARLMGYDRFLKEPADFLGNPFSQLDEIASSLMQMNELDFGNSTLTCPKCGMTLREFETEGRVGCIECYNTFNDNIVREMFKQQGNSEYAMEISDKAEEPVKETKAPAAKGGLTLDQLMKADLGMLSDEDLEKGIKVAAEAEEYKLASRLRDELKGRKDGGNNV